MQKKENDNAPIQEKLKQLYEVLHEYEDERHRSEDKLQNIAKTQEHKMSNYYKSKLKSLYSTAMQDAESEAVLLNKALSIIHNIRTIQNERRIASKHADHPKETMRRGTLMTMLQMNGPILPLWIGKRSESPPPLCGAIPAESSYISKVHDMVAAKVKSSKDSEEIWIIAEVIQFNHNTNKYEVCDIDEEQQDKHILNKKRIIPLPLMRANPETNPEALFPRDSLVLAVYPQTTCFYPAIVKDPPAKPADDYQVLFKDKSCPGGTDSTPFNVSQKYVIAKDGRKK